MRNETRIKLHRICPMSQPWTKWSYFVHKHLHVRAKRFRCPKWLDHEPHPMHHLMLSQTSVFGRFSLISLGYSVFQLFSCYLHEMKTSGAWSTLVQIDRFRALSLKIYLLRLSQGCTTVCFSKNSVRVICHSYLHKTHAWFAAKLICWKVTYLEIAIQCWLVFLCSQSHASFHLPDFPKRCRRNPRRVPIVAKPWDLVVLCLLEYRSLLDWRCHRSQSVHCQVSKWHLVHLVHWHS